jgi:hypothetical protein
MRWTGGAIERVEDFAIEAGGTVALDFDLQAGRVRVASDPGRPFPSWAVRRAEEERVLASVATTTGDFLLPAGDYVVMLRLEGRVAAERRVSVTAGQVQELRIPRP